MAGVTAKMIAQHLGVSQAAVSIALNGKQGIGDDTRKEILAAAERMGYDPGKLSAVRNQHRSLCFVFYVNKLVSIAENTTFSSFVLKGAEAAASALGYSMFVRYFRSGEAFASQMESQLQDIDGVILLGTDITSEDKEEVSAFLERVSGKPVVIIDSHDTFGVADCVCNDNYGGGAQAAAYLLERGCKSVGYIRSKQRNHNFRLREQGLADTLNEAGIKLDVFIDTDCSFDEAYNKMNEYLKRTDHIPEGFFAENDVIAAAAIRAFNANAIRVPEQVSIIGFDDIPICELTAPALTTVRSYKEQLGEAAVNNLASKLSSSLPEDSSEEHGCMTILVSTGLHIRGSVK